MADGDDLIEALSAAPDRIESWVVLLWTWLVPLISALDSRQENLAAIRKQGLAESLGAHADLVGALEALRAADDVAGAAARLLVRLERGVAESHRPQTIVASSAPAIDGTPCLVVARGSWLAEAFWPPDDPHAGDLPPAAEYPPSIATLAPRIMVVAQTVGAITLDPLASPEGDDIGARRSLARARQRLEAFTDRSPGGDGEPTRLLVHLATLGRNSLAGYVVDNRRGVFSYADQIEDDAIGEALATAVAAAARAGAPILVLPELALGAQAHGVLKTLLREADPAPALTVAGLRYLRGLGLSQVMLYVDGSNTGAIRVYERLGFTRWDVDVSYRRIAAAS